MKHSTFMGMANLVAKESNCCSLQVGAVLVINNRVIASGYNGTPEGYLNCSDALEQGVFDVNSHAEWSAKNEIHAEMNAVLRCPVDTHGASCYVTHSPCFNCTKHLVAAGIKSIYFETMYSKYTEDGWSKVVNYCVANKVELFLLKDGVIGHGVSHLDGGWGDPTAYFKERLESWL